jgi:TolB-like protein
MLETLGHYNVLDRIGAGGMGEVYRARDTRLGRTVAIKVLPPSVADDPERRHRLLKEARATAALSHPNIAALYETGEDGGRLFLVFEFVPGRTLDHEIDGRPMNPRRALDLVSQIADALAEAHAAGIVHRDIKPGNIMVTPKGRAKVLDFGLATWTTGGAEREQAASTTTLATAAGTAMGTVAYMSPEQALGERVDHRTDIFSLGIVLFETLTGRLPFQGTTPTALAMNIVQTPAPLVTGVNRSAPAVLDPIVEKALAKDASARYQSAANLAEDLRGVRAQLGLPNAAAGSAAPGITPAARRRRAVVTAGWVLAVAAVAAVLMAARGPVERLATRTWKQTIGAPPPPLIAVIPLETDAANTFFADGLTEDLITRLGQTPGLKVLGRSATRAYRGRSPREVAHELNAAVVLTGSVRPSADALKVSVELVDPSDGTALWTGQYTRAVKDVFAVQAQVAEDVAQALRVKLEPTASNARDASRLVDRRAYESYLRGRQAAAERNVPEARRRFEAAIQMDEGLAEAYGGLAEVLSLEPTLGGDADDPTRAPRLARAAARAYELAPDSPQANLAMGLAADRLSDRLASLKKAIAIDGSYSEGFHQIGDAIADFDPDRAIAFYQRALGLDPRLVISRGDIITTLAAAGRPDEARREIDAAQQAGGGDWLRPFAIGLALDDGRFADALALLDRDAYYRQSPNLTLEYANALRGAGRARDASAVAASLVGADAGNCDARATLAALDAEHGDLAGARRLVAPALQARSPADEGPLWLRCAVRSDAAIGNGRAAAALLRRIAADDRLFKAWSLDIMGTTGRRLLRAPTYPWTRISRDPAVVDAVRILDRSYAEAQRQSAAALADVTPR